MGFLKEAIKYDLEFQGKFYYIHSFTAVHLFLDGGTLQKVTMLFFSCTFYTHFLENKQTSPSSKNWSMYLFHVTLL